MLDRWGMPPGEIEARSRRVARQLAGERWRGAEAELAGALLYASGDPGLAGYLRFAGEPVATAGRALGEGAALLVDVGMVAAGIRLPPGRRMAVAVQLAPVGVGTTRAATGVRAAWDDCGAGGVVVIGNAPTALLAVLDLAGSCGAPACVVATCPGFSVAAQAKEALFASGLPCVAVAGTRGGSGLAAAALNLLLETVR
jgi:precorrin isomerase